MAKNGSAVEGLVLSGRFVKEQYVAPEETDGIGWVVLEVRKPTGEPYWQRFGFFASDRDGVSPLLAEFNAMSDQSSVSVAVEMRKGKTSGAAWMVALSMIDPYASAVA